MQDFLWGGVMVAGGWLWFAGASTNLPLYAFLGALIACVGFWNLFGEFLGGK